MPSIPSTRRARGAEHLDASASDPVVAAAEFRFLRGLNRWTAASAALIDAIGRRLAPSRGEPVTIADFGTGSGDIVATALHEARVRGWLASAVITDHSDGALAHARAQAAADSRISVARFDLLGDGPPPEGAPFRVAHASLVLHHFPDEGVVRALRSMAGCCDGLVVWNDLIRDRLGVAGARILTVGRSAALRNDAVLSVRRGFTLAEARAFGEAAGLEEIEVTRWRGARLLLTARPSASTGAGPVARPLIRARALGFTFGTRCVISNQSFVLRSGEVGLAAGPNGSGKTTLLRLLTGVLRPASGYAWADSSEGPIGYLPQRGGMISALSVGANLEILQRIAGIDRSERDTRSRAAIAQMGLEAIASRPVVSLSIGQARRAAIASVLATAGSTMLLDEPDAGLDADGRVRLGAAIVEHARDGGAALVASHEWSWLERACADARIPFARSVLG
jgi:ABC-type transport system involved in cytochrome c biogenesis ATPase subunit